MSRRKSVPHILCCASILALSVAGCSHNAGKLKSETNLTDNVPPESTSANKYGHALHVGRKSLRSKKAGTKTSAYENLWERLFDRYELPRIDHPDIDRELVWFVNHPDYINRVQSRAEPFLYSIVRQVEKREVPGEIALLPVIESAFKPHAISPAHAAGIWQFIPSTGRLYGLKKSRSYDGRRDVYASTRAAIKYLKKLHGDFGDWLLAIAAYNCGEGAVSRAIEKNQARGLPTDFWSLDLPRETRTYVPRLLAVSRVFANADQYGIDLREIPNKALFKTVVVKSQLDLALAADAADLSLDQMMELNPGFKHKVTDVHGSYRLFVPAHKYRSFKEALPRLVEAGVGRDRFERAESLFQEDLVTEATQQTAAADDSAKAFSAPRSDAPRHAGSGRDDKVAMSIARHDTPALNFKPRVHDRIPVEAPTRSRPAEPALRKTSYTVQGGDTLFSIARKNGVDVEQLREWNHLSSRSSIRSGQEIAVWSKESARRLPAISPANTTREPPSVHYRVKPGDSLSTISRRFNVTLADLRKWNGASVEKQFRPGMNLTVSSGD